MIEQKTIKKDFTLEGKGLQTGKTVKVFFYPGAANEGITFIRKDLEGKPPIKLSNLDSLMLTSDRRSIVGTDKENFIETPEHLLAGLWGAELDNLKIELDTSEPPALDGSAKVFLEAFKKAGRVSQNAERKLIEIKKPLWVEEKESFLGVFPSDVFKISYIFEHPYKNVKRQSFSKVIGPDLFESEIAPARTLWFVPQGKGSIEEKAEAAKARGYGRGADLENTLVIGENAFVNKARFSDEPVRHGVLDLIGDLYLLNKPIKGRFIAIRSGHKLNLELVKRIKKEYL